MPEASRKCSHCGGGLASIKLIDATQPGFDRDGAQHRTLSYAAADAERSFFSGKYPVQGEVAALMCVDCGSIVLFGVPR